MLQQDYLMKMIQDLVSAIRRTIERGKVDPTEAAGALDAAVGTVVDLDAETFFSLSPESVATILQVSGTDPHLVGYIARSLMLAGTNYEEGGRSELGELRRQQAIALANAYGFELSPDDVSQQALEDYFSEEEA